MEKYSNLDTVTVVDKDGTVFTLTDDLQRWGYVLKRNGGIDKRNNQAMILFKGPDGTTWQADNNGSLFNWKNKGWSQVVKDNKGAVSTKLIQMGQTDIFASVLPRRALSNPMTKLLPPAIQSQLGLNPELVAAPNSPKVGTPVNIMLATKAAGNLFTPTKNTGVVAPVVAPIVSPVVPVPPQVVTAAIEEKFAPVAPPESTMTAPLTANSPLYMQENNPVATTDAPLQAKGLTFSNPYIIAGMVVAVIVMVLLAKKFGKKPS